MRAQSLLIAMSNLEADASILGPATFLYLILALIFALGVRTLEMKLLLLGLLTALLAIWCTVLPGVQEGFEARVGQPGQIGMTLGGAGAGAVPGRIAILLILGALALAFFGRWSNGAQPLSRGREVP